MTREELQLVGPSQGQIFLISTRNVCWGCAGSGPLLQLNRNQTRKNDHKDPKLFENVTWSNFDEVWQFQK